METPARHSFTLDGATKVFPIPSNLKGDNYVRIEVDGVIIVDRQKYDIVNNSIVMNFIEDVPDGSQLDVLVVQSAEAIGSLAITTNIDIVATNIDTINTVGSSIASVNTAAANIVDIQNAEENAAAALASKIAAAASQTAAATSATSAATSATSSATSATASATSATAATTQATAAATSASSVLASEVAAASQASASATSAANAATSATSAATGATTATTKAAEASTSASNALTSETNASASATNASASASAAGTSESNAATSATGASTSATTATTQAGVATTQASNASGSAVSAQASLDTFTGQYVSQATAPTVSLDVGDLWFDTTASRLKVYSGTGFVIAGSAVSGVENSVEYTATAGQTSFAAIYDAGNLMVYLNGIRLDGADYTATDGANVVLDTGATVGDTVFIQSFGTFVVADHYTKGVADLRFLTPTGDGSALTGIDALPDQATHTGKFLGTDGTDATWNTIAGGGPSLGTDSIIRTNAQTISEDITIPVGTNGMSIGDITIADTYTVTVDGRWVVI